MGDPKDESKVDVLGVRVDRAERDIAAVEVTMEKGFERLHQRITEGNKAAISAQSVMVAGLADAKLAFAAALADTKLAFAASVAESRLAFTTALTDMQGQKAGSTATVKFVFALVATLLGVAGYLAGKAGP